MVAVMNLTGYVMVGHGHHQNDVFPVISAHIVGMYGLVLVVGDLIERIGRRESLVAGLAIMAASTIGLVWVGEHLRHRRRPVRARARLEPVVRGRDHARSSTSPRPSERAQLVGFSDLLSGLTGASLALLGGLAYSEQGVQTLAIGATLAVLAAGDLARVSPGPRRADRTAA